MTSEAREAQRKSSAISANTAVNQLCAAAVLQPLLVKTKSLGKWSMTKQFIAEIVSAFNPNIKDSLIESEDLVYSISFSKQYDVSVRYKPDGQCETWADIYKRDRNNVVQVSKTRSDGMPFSFMFIVELEGYAGTNKDHLDFSQSITDVLIIE